MQKKLSLKTTKQLVSLIKKKLSHNANFPHGASCMFIPISKRMGIKIYGERYERDHAYSVQKDLARKNFAPNIGRRFSFSISTNNPFIKYNMPNLDFFDYTISDRYETQTNPIYNYDNAEWVVNNIKLYCYVTEIADIIDFCNEDEFEEKYFDFIYDKLISYGYLENDIHSGNIGFKNNKPILIDCAYTIKLKIKNNYIYSWQHDSTKWEKFTSLKNFKKQYGTICHI